MKSFRRTHCLCFHPTLNKICSIYHIQGEVIQQPTFGPKLRREEGTAKVESTGRCSEREADTVIAGSTTGGLVLEGNITSS